MTISKPFVMFWQYVPGQTACGVFSNVFDAVDRETVGGWYITVHVGPYRLNVLGKGEAR